MDPDATLLAAASALLDGELAEAGDFLSCYRIWRQLGGLEPEGGDRFASMLAARLDLMTALLSIPLPAPQVPS